MCRLETYQDKDKMEISFLLHYKSNGATVYFKHAMQL